VKAHGPGHLLQGLDRFDQDPLEPVIGRAARMDPVEALRHEYSRRSAPLRGLLLMLGLLGAAVLNGQFAVVESWIIQSGMAQHPWRGVGYAALCATAVFAVIWFFSQRLLARSPFRRPS